MNIIAWLAFGLGAWICLVNFYLSFIRYPLHRFRGMRKESFRWVSGFPVIGSLLVGLSLSGLKTIPGLWIIAMVLIAIDTGGIHWFVGSMVYHSVYGKRRDEEPSAEDRH